jgi:hypothetical protein
MKHVHLPHDDGPCIGGMTYATYDPEQDPRGDIGHALADARFAQNTIESRIHAANESHRFAIYEAFLVAGCNTSNPSWMCEVLERHFPARFGPKGKQPLASYDDAQIYGVYNGMRKTAQAFVDKIRARERRHS